MATDTKKLFSMFCLFLLVASLALPFFNIGVNAQSATNVSSSPEINAGFSDGSTSYNTPEVLALLGTYTLTADTLVTFGSRNYTFNHWTVDGVSYGTAAIEVDLGGVEKNLVIYYDLVTEDTAVSSNPAIGALFTVEGVDTYATPQTLTLEGTYTLTAEANPVSGGVTYAFNHWLINGSDSYSTRAIELTLGSGASTAVIYYDVLYGVAVSSSPEINAAITVDSTVYSSPQTLNLLGAHTFTAQETKIFGSNAYNFTNWLVNGTTSYTSRTQAFTITGASTIQAVYGSISGLYVFYGPYSESTGLALNENVSVTVHYSTAGKANLNFILNGSYPLAPEDDILYFEYKFTDNSTRQYWVDPSETITNLYVFRDDENSFTNYVINFLDYTGTLQNYPWVEAQLVINGTAFTVEKRKADSQNSVGMNLVDGRKYQILIKNAVTTYVYGDLLMTSATGVQLILRGVDFPKETLLQYPYITVYGLRNFGSPTGSISIYYNDSKAQTTSFTATITNAYGAVVYTTTLVSNTINLNWTSAVNSSIYYASVTVVHGEYGTFTWHQTFANEAGDNGGIFSFSFLGDWSFNTAYIIPALIILLVAACFSALNAEVGAILCVVAGIVLAYMGWLPIPVGALVSGFALAILMALVYNKRRVQLY